MPGFLAAIPLIGPLVDSVFNGIDKISTTDEERLKFKTEMWQVFAPVISLLVQAQASFDQAQKDIQIATIESGDSFIRRVRPTLMCLTFIAWVGLEAFMLYHPTPEVGAAAQRAFYAFGLIGGLFTVTRGAEKAITQWVSGKSGNGKE